MRIDRQGGRGTFDLRQRCPPKTPDIDDDIDAVPGAKAVLMSMAEEMQAIGQAPGQMIIG